MANLVTLASLKEQARERADQVNSNFVSDSELVRYLNASIKKLYDKLVAAYGDDYYLAAPYDLTTDGTASSYDLPDDFYKLVGVDVLIGGQAYTAVKPYMFDERNQYRAPYFTLRSTDNAFKYRLQNNSLNFIPTPSAGKTFRIWYTPICTPLAVDADSFDFINGWEEYPIIDTAIKMMSKEESDTSELRAQLREMDERLVKMKKNRDLGSPARITDSRKSEYYWDMDRGYEF